MLSLLRPQPQRQMLLLPSLFLQSQLPLQCLECIQRRVDRLLLPCCSGVRLWQRHAWVVALHVGCVGSELVPIHVPDTHLQA